MAQQPAGSNGNPLFDLVCVALLGLLLWFGAQAIGTVTRASGLHPVSTEHGAPAAH